MKDLPETAYSSADGRLKDTSIKQTAYVTVGYTLGILNPLQGYHLGWKMKNVILIPILIAGYNDLTPGEQCTSAAALSVGLRTLLPLLPD